MINFLAEASASNATSASGGMLSMLLPLIFMFVLMYFLIMRPENKRKKEAEAMRNSIKNGDQIVTIGGICGTVVNVKEDRLVIETSADLVRVEITKWAVSSNETAEAAAKAAAKKEEEARAKAKAAKKAEKNR